jgi:hypothetical protein
MVKKRGEFHMPQYTRGTWAGFLVAMILIHGSMASDRAHGDDPVTDTARFRLLRAERVKD